MAVERKFNLIMEANLGMAISYFVKTSVLEFVLWLSLEQWAHSKHSAVLGLPMTKTIKDTYCYLETAVAWAINTKKECMNNNDFPPNHLVFSKNGNYPSIETDLPPALENKTFSKLVQENLNTLHSARENFIKTESSEKLKKSHER